MFCVTVTRNRPTGFPGSCVREERQVGGFIVTAVTDSVFSRFEDIPGGYKITESCPDDADHGDIPLSEVIIDSSAGQLGISTPMLYSRPIYYHVNDRGEFFSSTHVSMLRAAGVAIEENADALPEFFMYRYVMPPRTLYRNIHKVTAGDRLTVSIGRERCEVSTTDRFDPFADRNPHTSPTIEEAQDEALHILSGSVASIRPDADRIAVLLSGGLDSSILFRLCGREHGTGDSYSTAYPFQEERTDIEKGYALTAADAFGTKHAIYETTNECYLRGLVGSIAAAEEPVDHLQSVMFHLLFGEGLHSGKKVIVSGDGADGLLGLRVHNYIHRYGGHKRMYDFFSQRPFFSSLALFSSLTGRMQDFVRALETVGTYALDMPTDDPRSIVWSVDSYGNEEWVCRYFNATPGDIIENRRTFLSRFEGRSLYDLLSVTPLYSTARGIWSKLGESTGKAAVYPFVDRQFVEYTFSVDWEIKLKQPNNILRGVARNLDIPDFIIERKKSGFGVHPEHWATRGGVFEPLLGLAEKTMDTGSVRELQSTDQTKAMTFWNVLNYAIWKRLCINNEPTAAIINELDEYIGNSGTGGNDDR